MTTGIRKTRAEAAATMAVDHIVHLYAAEFAAIVSGKMCAIVLQNRLYAVGDTLIFCEVGKAQMTTGAQQRRLITHINPGYYGLLSDYVALSLGGVNHGA